MSGLGCVVVVLVLSGLLPVRDTSDVGNAGVGVV